MEYTAGNIQVREMRFEKAGDVVAGHDHNFDHVTYVARGALRIEMLNGLGGAVVRVVEKRASEGRNWILIRAGAFHRITALDDHSMGHCIYAHRTPQGDVVQEWDGWTPAYV